MDQAQAEREDLEQAARASEMLYRFAGEHGHVRVRMTQPVLPTGKTDEPIVPRVREDELHIRQAGVRQRDQARSRNLQAFKEREEQRLQREQTTGAVVGQLAGATGAMGQPPPPNVAAAQQDVPPTPVIPPLVAQQTEEELMDTAAVSEGGAAQPNEGDDPMGDGGEGAKEGEDGKTTEEA
ncbi:MAG: hypothetical protein GY835_10030 [bacterium]|nr:hypothetical protein [bacterium]